MDGSYRNQVTLAIVAGFLAIMASIAGEVMRGRTEHSLADQQFQTQLIFRALEPKTAEERIERLDFMMSLELVRNPAIRAGLRPYLARERAVPQFAAGLGNIVDLTRADLAGIDLSGVDLSGQDLRNVDFTDANLTDANLSNANLQGADLTRATLSGANLAGTDLRGAIASPRTVWPEGFDPDARGVELVIPR